MSIPPESIEVGRCYLVEGRTGVRICRVTVTFPEGRLTYEHRVPSWERTGHWRKAWTSIDMFASFVSREVPCDWTPEADEVKP